MPTEHIVQSAARSEYQHSPENDFVHTKEFGDEHAGGDDEASVRPEGNQTRARARECESDCQEPGNRAGKSQHGNSNAVPRRTLGILPATPVALKDAGDENAGRGDDRQRSVCGREQDGQSAH